MKRILLMVMCFVVLSMEVCSAEIFRHTDEFSGGNVIRSNISCGKSYEGELVIFL